MMKYLFIGILGFSILTVNAQDEESNAIVSEIDTECRLQFNNGNFLEAAECYLDGRKERGIPQTDKSFFTFCAAIAYHKAEDFKQAKKWYKKVLDPEHEQPLAYNYLADIYISEGDTDAAIDLLEDGMEAYPGNNDIVITLINIHIEKEDMDAVSTTIDQAIVNDPGNAILYFTKAAALDTDVENEEVEEAYLKAIELDPDYFDAVYNLAAYHFNIAVDVLDVAAKTDDNAAYAQMYDEAMEHFEKAQPLMQHAHKLMPNDRFVNQALEVLDSRLGDN